MRASLEWRIFETGRDTHKLQGHTDHTDYAPAWINDDGKPALLCDITTAFSKEAAGQSSPAQGLRQNVDDQVTDQLFEKASGLTRRSLWEELLWFETRNAVLRGEAEVLDKQNLDIQDLKEDASVPMVHRYEDYTRKGCLIQSVVERTLRNKSLQSSRCSFSEHQHSADLGDICCEFYNVLWIERKDGIVYRRACGWVPKHIWEAHATGPVDVKLG
jgi:hypothetical protein